MPVLLMEPTGTPDVYMEHRATARRVRKRSLVQSQTGAFASVVNEVFRVPWEPLFDQVDESWRILLSASPVDASRIAVKGAADFAVSDFGARSRRAAVDVPSDYQNKSLYVALARPARHGDFSFVYWYHPESRFQRFLMGELNDYRPANQIGAWIQSVNDVVLGGEPHRFIRSRVPLSLGAMPRMMEAG